MLLRKALKGVLSPPKWICLDVFDFVFPKASGAVSGRLNGMIGRGSSCLFLETGFSPVFLNATLSVPFIPPPPTLLRAYACCWCFRSEERRVGKEFIVGAISSRVYI